jgi:uncharacterized membrane protein
MSATYNRFAGQSLDRLAALSDGIFAVAMTLLVLDLRVPAEELIRVHTEQELWGTLGNLKLRFIAYFMSFLTLGIFWLGQQTQLSHFSRSNRNLVWLQFGFLLAVTLMPFSTGLLAEFTAFRTTLLVYWFNILLLGVWLYLSWRYAGRAGILKDDVTPEMRSAVIRRIVVAQALYAFGALLCVVSTYASIAFIVLVQLNYVIAPRIRGLYRL